MNPFGRLGGAQLSVPNASSSSASGLAAGSTPIPGDDQALPLTSPSKAIKLSLFDATGRPGEVRCNLCEDHTSTAKEGILMYHVLGKKDNVKSRHAMCKRFDDWGEDHYWDVVFTRINTFLLGKPNYDVLISKITESYPQISCKSSFVTGRWMETLALPDPMIHYWLDQKLSDFRPRSDEEALSQGPRKFNEIVGLFHGPQHPIQFHISSYARGLLILAIGPESVMQLELNTASSERKGNVVRLWMNWVLREMLYVYVAQYIESGTEGYPLPQEWAKAYVREHMIYLCHLDQPHMRHMTTDYCRWLLWCTNNFYVGPKRILMFRSLEKMFRAYEDAFFDSEEALRSGTTQEKQDRFEFADIIVATISHELSLPRRLKR